MPNRKVIFSLVAFTILFLLYLFIAGPKVAIVTACNGCGQECPGDGCSNTANYCVGSRVENVRVCQTWQCFSSSCSIGDPGYCDDNVTSITVTHSDNCPYGCSNGSCNPPPPAPTPPPVVNACDPPGSACGTCTSRSCSDGKPCAIGHTYCVYSGGGNYCGGCVEEVNNCATQCAPAPPPPQVCTPNSQGPVCNTGWCPSGTVCAQGHKYCLWDGSGYGACSEEVNNCATQCAPPPTPPPGCPAMTCRYSQNVSTGVCGSGVQWVSGNGCNGDNCAGCTYIGGCSITSCATTAPTPTPAPPGPTPPPPGSTPPPGSCGGAGQPPCCNAGLLTMTSNSPRNLGSSITFTTSGTQGSTWLGDSWSGGVDCTGTTWGGKTCKTTSAVTNVPWIHTWRNCAPNNCGIVYPNLSYSPCSKQALYTVVPLPTPTPTPGPPWIQTTSGDVHSNGRINTPGGP